jgi:hypothetical protein
VIPKIEWLALFMLVVLAVAYAAYESRVPGPCAFEHTGSCAPRVPMYWTGAH